jgi:Kdo2-lipid IVA lauroyltransferase/acyltransferase
MEAGSCEVLGFRKRMYFWPMRWILLAISRLPFWMLYGISWFLFFLIYVFPGYRKQVVLKNLSLAFPEKSDQERKKIRKEFYKRFADFAVEVLKGLTLSKEEMIRRVEIVNPQVFDAYAREGATLVVLTSHQFNWEWALASGCAQLPLPVDAVYQKLSLAAIDRVMYETRSRFGGKPINRRYVLKELIRTKHRAKAVAMVADQAPGRKSPTHWTTFLHQETGFSLGPQQIPQMLKCDVYFLKIRRKSRGNYSIEFISLGKALATKDDFSLLDRYIACVEQLVKEEPEGWLWTHKRWKRGRPKDS